ncbi:unnamed protein product, partial [Staurois parvus]
MSFFKKLLLHSKTLLFQCISHTFCPYCFVLCPACILTVLSAWKLRKVHGVQKSVPLGQKPVLDQLENSDSKSEPLAELSDNDSWRNSSSDT